MVERVTALLYCVGTCSLIEVSKQNAYEQRREQIWVRDGNITWVCKNEKACQRQRKITEAMQKSLTKLQLIFKNPEESGLLMPLDTILWRECNKIFKQGSNRIRFVIWKVQLFILFDFSRLFLSSVLSSQFVSSRKHKGDKPLHMDLNPLVRQMFVSKLKMQT